MKDPPADSQCEDDSYFVPCDAIPPRFSVTVGGSQFFMSPKDMINQEIRDPNTGWCQVSTFHAPDL